MFPHHLLCLIGEELLWVEGFADAIQTVHLVVHVDCIEEHVIVTLAIVWMRWRVEPRGHRLGEVELAGMGAREQDGFVVLYHTHQL